MNGDSALNHFPMPGNGGRGSDMQHLDFHPSNAWTNWGSEGNVARRDSSSSLRQKDENSHLGSQASGYSPAPPSAAAPSPSRLRRQSLANSTTTRGPATTRTARKSIGPGSLMFPNAPTTKQQPNSTARKSSADSSRGEHLQVQPRPRPQHLDSSGKLSFTELRNLKAKSFHSPTKENPESSLAVPWDAVRPRSSSSDLAETPSKSAPGQRATPSSAGKRMSVIPPHATGLGARTISPSDVRRMKRMSMAPPQPPPVPRTPTQNESAQWRPTSSSAQSPGHLARKSVTPSSTRATPDPNRKPYNLGPSLPPTPNHTAAGVRSSIHSLLQKPAQAFPVSRIPTPKPRAESVNMGSGEEEVPPVPAIPRAYGSPKDGQESSVQTTEDLANASNRRVVRTPNSNVNKRKSLQPLKLPPLHLLPLSTPIASKIESLREKHAYDPKPQTPTTQPMAKTPSTPLTASKAHFDLSHEDDDGIHFPQVRSSTSHFLNTAPTPIGTFSRSSASALGNTDLSMYPSDPLQRKQSGEYNGLRQNPLGDYSLRALQLSRLHGSRPQTQASAALSRNGESLSRLSTSSDAGRDSAAGSELFPARSRDNNLKADQKLEAITPGHPASMGTRGLSPFKSGTPNLAKSTLTQPRRSQETAGSNTNPLNADLAQAGGAQNLTLTRAISGEPIGHDRSTVRTTSSILSPVQRIISSAKLNAGGRTVPSTETDDETAADEEVKKLNSKKKDFEEGAKKLEELRRKATPKERVGPAQALKIANLNIFERGEIIDFKDIYFCGTQNAKKRVGDLNAQSANFGYDDDKGDYNIVLGDHLAYRYEVLDVLGKGSFGQVMRCIDHKTGDLVAIKIIRNRKRFHQQALIEVNLLKKLKEWVSSLRQRYCA